MFEENISHKFRIKNIDETRIYFIEEINQNEWISMKHRKVCTALNYTKHLLVLVSEVTERVSISVSRDHEFCSRIKNVCSNCRI